MAGSSDPGARPFPPGDYQAVVVGSGPGALQVSYYLRRYGVRHAVISADAEPGGMFLKWPFFQRLLSWTKPHASYPRGTRFYQRYDWNSLLAEEPEASSLQAPLMDGTSYFPSRPEMEANLKAYAAAADIKVRYGCTWTGTRREPGPDGDTFILETTDGEYRTPVAIFAVGVAEPYTPNFPGRELVAHYADTRDAASYAGRRLFIIGKQNSGFELASGLTHWAPQIALASPSPAKTSIETHSLVGVRARYVQPFEDHALGGGVSILSASIRSVERGGDGGLVVNIAFTEGGREVAVPTDEVIAATGFTCPLVDLPALGVATFGASRLPAQTNWWESATVPGIYFAGTINQGVRGLYKHGMPSYSGAVHGHRYNARIIAGRVAETRFGYQPERPVIAPRDLLDHAVAEIAHAPELWHQKAFLSSVISADPSVGLRNEGIKPLAAMVDGSGPDSIFLTVEADGTGLIYPVIYLRRNGRVEEFALEPDPLLAFDSPEYRRRTADVLSQLVPEVSAD